MQTRSSGILFSIISRNLSYLPRHLNQVLSFTRYNSSESNRPSVGARRTDDSSEESVIRDLNFRDKKTRGKADEAEPKPSSPIPGRPLRKERGMEVSHEDLFPDFNSKQHSLNRGRPNRPLKGGEGRGGSRPFEQRPKPDNERTNGDFDFFSHKSSVSSADTLGKGEEKKDGNIKNGGQEEGSRPITESLFDKLKLGVVSGDQTGGGAALQETPPEAPPEDADEIFKKMKEAGLIPNAVAMLDGLCKDGLVQEAMKLFGLMREKRTIPEVVIYTAVVEGFCKAAKFDDAKRIFRKMQKNDIVPNAFSYSVLIQGLCKGKRVEDAVEFSLEMVDAGHMLNGATFTALVDMFCKEKGIKEAEDLVRNLRERGYALDEKAIREHLDKKGPYSPMVWEAIFGKKSSQRPF